jgi:hypothetical protein
MKILFLLITSILISMAANAQGLKLDWAKQIGGAGDGDVAVSAAIDKQGNVYTIGNFSKTVDFDPNSGVFNLTANGSADIFIQKLDAQGNFKWVKQMGGIEEDWASAITTDTKGNIYTIGIFMDTVDFDPGPGVFQLKSNGGADIFIQKLNSTGDFLWAKQLGGIGFEGIAAIKVDSSGSIYTTGSFAYTVDFDPGAGSYDLVSQGGDDIFILKLNSAGDFVWAKQIGGIRYDNAGSMITNVNGSMYLTGEFQDEVDVDPGATIFNLNANGETDIFILKLDLDGNFIWAKQLGGTGFDFGRSITEDAKGNTYTIGFFEDIVDFDPGTNIFNLTAKGKYDVFIQKLDANGNFLWVKQIGGEGTDDGRSIFADSNGNVYSTGHFQNTVDVDPGLAMVNFASNGEDDIFIQKLDTDGNFLGAKQMGGSGFDFGVSIISDADGYVYTTGSFSNTMYVDAAVSFTSNGVDDAFIQKLEQCPSPLKTYTQRISACHQYTLNHQTFTTNGVYSQIINCDSILTISLKIISTNVIVFQNGNTLSTDAIGDSYQWIDCNNGKVAITGATGQNYTPATNGSYAIVVTADGCSDTSACHDVIINTIEKKESKNGIIISPNPFSMQTTVQSLNILKDATLIVYNSLGQAVRQIDNLSGQSVLLNRDALPAGLYFIRLMQDNSEMMSQKLLIIN